VFSGVSESRSPVRAEIAMTFAKTSICVSYKFVDGWHIFSSDELPALYVASLDPEKAFRDVGPSIELLLKLNDRIECTVRPELDFSEFIARVKTKEDESEERLVLSHRRFAVYAHVGDPVAA
jgi:hypothetical protein